MNNINEDIDFKKELKCAEVLKKRKKIYEQCGNDTKNRNLGLKKITDKYYIIFYNSTYLPRAKRHPAVSKVLMTQTKMCPEPQLAATINSDKAQRSEHL